MHYWQKEIPTYRPECTRFASSTARGRITATNCQQDRVFFLSLTIINKEPILQSPGPSLWCPTAYMLDFTKGYKSFSILFQVPSENIIL